MQNYVWILIFAAVLVVLVAIPDQLASSALVRDWKSRVLAGLVIAPIAVLCTLAVAFAYTSWNAWVVLLLAPLVLAAGVAGAIYLVGHILPSKISSREHL